MDSFDPIFFSESQYEIDTRRDFYNAYIEANYIIEKYAGAVYCGNGVFVTMQECMEFANDGFCDKVIIKDLRTGQKVEKYL